MAPKNIVVCADGTGNKGGYSPDSNVYRLYKMVNKHFKGTCHDGVDIEEQILFYDNGVGTQSNKFWRTISGAFGLGFRRNVCDLYKFLARNYVPGDRIFFFGFSRGASTVRACNGMIAKCGLAKGRGLRNQALDELVEEAYKAYEKHRKQPRRAENFKNDTVKSHGAVPIQLLGVWDTVVALGFPKRTDITGPFTFILNTVFVILEKFFDLIFPHSFYHYQLGDNVKYAYQALAIDDERTAFWPYVWYEKNIWGAQDRTPENSEQVWFAGMHSNVGGGYERAGMAGVPLYWMLLRAQKHGLVFNEDALQQTLDSRHVHGRMYNSRSGLAAFYRYHPREIEKLCEDKLVGEIRIHDSVIERMSHRTANYAPGQVPSKFEVVNDQLPTAVKPHEPGLRDSWTQIRAKIKRLVWLRKLMYSSMLLAVLAIIGYAIYLWNTLTTFAPRRGPWGEVANILDYFTPDMFDGLIQVAVVQKHEIFVTAVVALILYVVVNRVLVNKTVAACESLRHLVITEPVDNADQS